MGTPDDPASALAPPVEHRHARDDEVADSRRRFWIPVGQHPMAIIAGYLGLLSFMPLVGVVLGPTAVAVAIMAHRRIHRDPGLGGKYRIVFACVAGALGTILSVIEFIPIVIVLYILVMTYYVA